MFSRCCLFLLVICLPVVASAADVVLVDEDFEGFVDQNDLNTVWGPDDGQSLLVDETFTEFLTLDDLDLGPQDVGARAFPEGGQGVQHLGGDGSFSVLEFMNLNGGAPIAPTAEQSIVLQGDIFDVGNIGNKRVTIGLRSASPAANLVEIGHFNESPVELAARTILFESAAAGEQPNWQFYELPLALDTNEDGVTTLGELGEAWHTHRATITPTTVTYEIDLFRDGLNADTGEPGFDASLTFEVEPTADGFTSLRIGGPSGITSAGNGFYGGVIFDNISLTLVDLAAGQPGDYNGDGVVDAADYTVWRDTLGDSVEAGTGADGSGNGAIDLADYTEWVNNFGAGSSGLAVAVPEPAAAALLCLLATSCFVWRGNR